MCWWRGWSLVVTVVVLLNPLSCLTQLIFHSLTHTLPPHSLPPSVPPARSVLLPPVPGATTCRSARSRYRRRHAGTLPPAVPLALPPSIRSLHPLIPFLVFLIAPSLSPSLTAAQEFTQSGGVRPFGLSLLVAGYDDNGPQLFQVRREGEGGRDREEESGGICEI